MWNSQPTASTMKDSFDIKAELLLSVLKLSPETIHAHLGGRFSRGYMSELEDYDEKGNVRIGRPGLLHLVPEGLFYDEEYLRDASTDKEEQKHRMELQERRKEQWSTFFKPFDTILFGKSLTMHQKAYDCERKRDITLASILVGFDLEKERDIYVKQLACLLLNTSIKGNVDMLGFYVSSILKERVETQKMRLTPDANRKSVVFTKVQFTMVIEGLTTTEYRRRMEQYEPFFQYLQLWFLPFDCECEYAIKDMSNKFVLGENITLDYNTHF